MMCPSSLSFSMNWIKCHDKGKTPMPPCIFADIPKALGVLSSADMDKIGYCTCKLNGEHYLVNTPRPDSCGYRAKYS
jgi:hypothetical protein